MTTWSKTTGTEYTASMSEAMHIDSTIATELELQMGRRFSETIQTSTTTGHDWTQESSETYYEAETIEVEVTIAPRNIQNIYFLTILFTTLF